MTTYPDTGAPEHPAFTEAFERMLASIPTTVLTPLQAARRELAEAERELSRAYPEGAALAEAAVDRKRAEVARLERAAIQKPIEV